MRVVVQIFCLRYKKRSNILNKNKKIFSCLIAKKGGNPPQPPPAGCERTAISKPNGTALITIVGQHKSYLTSPSDSTKARYGGGRYGGGFICRTAGGRRNRSNDERGTDISQKYYRGVGYWMDISGMVLKKMSVQFISGCTHIYRVEYDWNHF